MLLHYDYYRCQTKSLDCLSLGMKLTKLNPFIYPFFQLSSDYVLKQEFKPICLKMRIFY